MLTENDYEITRFLIVWRASWEHLGGLLESLGSLLGPLGVLLGFWGRSWGSASGALGLLLGVSKSSWDVCLMKLLGDFDVNDASWVCFSGVLAF